MRRSGSRTSRVAMSLGVVAGSRHSTSVRYGVESTFTPLSQLLKRFLGRFEIPPLLKPVQRCHQTLPRGFRDGWALGGGVKYWSANRQTNGYWSEGWPIIARVREIPRLAPPEDQAGSVMTEKNPDQAIRQALAIQVLPICLHPGNRALATTAIQRQECPYPAEREWDAAGHSHFPSGSRGRQQRAATQPLLAPARDRMDEPS